MIARLVLVVVLVGGTCVLLLPPGAVVPGSRNELTRGRPGALLRVVAVAAGLIVVVAALDGTTLVLGVIALASAADIGRRTQRGRVRRNHEHVRAQVLVACEAMAADIRAGVTPAAAVEAAVDVWPALTSVARAARIGADVPEALRSLAARPGAERLSAVAAAWLVAHRTGAPMAATLELAANTLRDERAVAEVVATEIAAARATALLLALLPAGVLLLAQGIGGDAVGLLLTTPAGLACLAAGLALTHLGLAWLDVITDGMRP